MYDQQPVQIYSKQFGGKERALSRTATAIPYRALLPKDSENLIVAGRRLSVEEMALGVVPAMPPCMAMPDNRTGLSKQFGIVTCAMNSPVDKYIIVYYSINTDIVSANQFSKILFTQHFIGMLGPGMGLLSEDLYRIK